MFTKEDLSSLRIYVAGHTGMVGSAILRSLRRHGCKNLILKNHADLDLRDSVRVRDFFRRECPDIVIDAAAKVGGIEANRTHMAEFLLDNMKMQNNLIENSFQSGIKKFCFLCSNCAYPKHAKQPYTPDTLLTGSFEPTNEGYALAKVTGYKLCLYLAKQYGFHSISLMPCNLYGENDHFSFENSHVLSALVRRFCEAAEQGSEEVICWGTGLPLREFLYVDDMADAVYDLLLTRDAPELLNIGSGSEISMKDLALRIAEEAGYRGKIVWDTSKPDGMMRKFMDSSEILKTGWTPQTTLRSGIQKTIAFYRSIKAKGIK